MALIQKVRIIAIEEDGLMVKLPGGATFRWPAEPEQINKLSYSVGDEVTLTMNSAADIINELLNGDHE
ncbi:MAG: hypothetical protein ABIG66_01090 [Candidatus Kerfeldbacteria bacterium]